MILYYHMALVFMSLYLVIDIFGLFKDCFTDKGFVKAFSIYLKPSFQLSIIITLLSIPCVLFIESPLLLAIFYAPMATCIMMGSLIIFSLSLMRERYAKTYFKPELYEDKKDEFYSYLRTHIGFGTFMICLSLWILIQSSINYYF